MHFQIQEDFIKQSRGARIWEVIQGYLMIFYLPIALGKYLINRLRGIKEPELREENTWLEHAQFDGLKLWSLALDNEATSKIYESETLDFPNWEDHEDPFRFLLKFRTEPAIPELENAFFDEVELVTGDGIYLIRINEEGKGMTLCLLSAKEKKLIDIARIKPLSWLIEKTAGGDLQLTGYADKGKHVVKVSKRDGDNM